MRKLIGKGTFTKAYQISETEVEIVSICPAKECYAMFSQGNTFAPKIEKEIVQEDELLKSKGIDVYHSIEDNNLTEDELLNELFGE